MNKYQNKYGFKEDDSTKDFHRNRRMFCIYKNELIIAQPNLEYSHAEWFEKEGWITEEDESLMLKGVRGYVEDKGDIYFYTGYDFRIDRETEETFFKYLDELVYRLGINKKVSKIFGGMKRDEGSRKWKPRKEYQTEFLV